MAPVSPIRVRVRGWVRVRVTTMAPVSPLIPHVYHPLLSSHTLLDIKKKTRFLPIRG